MSKDVVLYNLNGKYFLDYGVYISKSTNLVGKLEQKNVASHDWAEYDGIQIDTQTKPRYKPRSIVLDGFILGDNWQAILDSFNELFNEFDKLGTQRLVIEPFEFSALVYDVVLDGQVELVKQFQEGVMFGTFSLKLLEPQPIKKVYRLEGDTLNLKFESDKWVDVNIDGRVESINGGGEINGDLDQGLSIHYIAIYGDVENVVTNAIEIKALE